MGDSRYAARRGVNRLLCESAEDMDDECGVVHTRKERETQEERGTEAKAWSQATTTSRGGVKGGAGTAMFILFHPQHLIPDDA